MDPFGAAPWLHGVMNYWVAIPDKHSYAMTRSRNQRRHRRLQREPLAPLQHRGNCRVQLSLDRSTFAMALTAMYPLPGHLARTSPRMFPL